jgi:hypothetical protein
LAAHVQEVKRLQLKAKPARNQDLQLYHNINSVCAKKVRIALHEKRQNVTEHLLKIARGPERTRISVRSAAPKLNNR